MLSFPLVPAMYTRDISDGALEVCATDAAAVNATVRVSGRPDTVVSLTPLAPCVRSNITADAAYSIVVVGVDAAGNAAAPADVAFVFDRQPPSSTLVLASDSKSGGFVNVTSVSLAANATDALSPWSMEARRDGGAWVSVSTLAALSSRLSDGVRVFEVRSTDAAGNVEPLPYATVTVTVDTVPPVLSFTMSLPRYLGNVSEAVCITSVDASNVTSTVYAGAWSASLALAAATRLSQCVTVPVPGVDGNHSVSVQGVDSGGNIAAPLHDWFVVDRVPPAVTWAFQQRPVAGGCVQVLDSSGDEVATLRVCNVSDAAVVSTACDVGASTTGSAAVAPCFLQWRLETVQVTTAVTTCGGGVNVTRTSSMGPWAATHPARCPSCSGCSVCHRRRVRPASAPTPPRETSSSSTARATRRRLRGAASCRCRACRWA